MFRTFNVLKNMNLSKLTNISKNNNQIIRNLNSTISKKTEINNYYNYWFWVRKKFLYDTNKNSLFPFMNINETDDIYIFGIKPKFIYDYGNIKYININKDIINVYPLSLDEEIGVIENDKIVFNLNIPFENVIITNINDDIKYEHINNNPGNVGNYLYEFKICENDYEYEQLFKSYLHYIS